MCVHTVSSLVPLSKPKSCPLRARLTLRFSRRYWTKTGNGNLCFHNKTTYSAKKTTKDSRQLWDCSFGYIGCFVAHTWLNSVLDWLNVWYSQLLPLCFHPAKHTHTHTRWLDVSDSLSHIRLTDMMTTLFFYCSSSSVAVCRAMWHFHVCAPTALCACLIILTFRFGPALNIPPLCCVEISLSVDILAGPHKDNVSWSACVCARMPMFHGYKDCGTVTRCTSVWWWRNCSVSTRSCPTPTCSASPSHYIDAHVQNFFVWMCTRSLMAFPSLFTPIVWHADLGFSFLFNLVLVLFTVREHFSGHFSQASRIIMTCLTQPILNAFST